MCYTLSAMMRFVLALVLLSTAGCAWLRAAPTPILPPEELYALGERKLERYGTALLGVLASPDAG